MDVLKIWQMNEILNVFQIPIKITNPDTNTTIIKPCVFDTVFTGFLGLDNQSINSLGLMKIGKGQGWAVSGKIEYDNYRGQAEFGDVKSENLGIFQNIDRVGGLDVNQIPIQIFRIPILGMGIICQYRWLLAPDQKCILLVR